MAKQIESLPEARLLLMSLRSVGYTEETAIADIIDNSISADATDINVQFDWDNRRILIVDNGNGMDELALIENMRIGSADPMELRSPKDLGRFGMGMKTAAFALGRKLTVISKAGGIYSNAAWDLDAVPEFGWNLIVQDDDALNEFYSWLGIQGTVVIIEKLDRLIDEFSLEKSKNRFYKAINRVEEHLRLTFHRFIEEDGLILRIQGTPVTPWNPFVLNNRATEEKPEEICLSDDGLHQAVIQPYILPHKTKFSSQEEYEKAGGSKGWNYHQGIYVYRNKRLIVYGTWFEHVKKEPAYNLARIKLDISSDCDELWNIDIKKSMATLPLFMRETVEHVIEITTENSARVYNSRGTYSKNAAIPNLSYVWEQRKVGGRYSFHINKKHTLLSSIRVKLDEEGKDALSAYLSLVENFAPFMVSGVAASYQTKENAPEVDTLSIEYKSEAAELRKYIQIFKAQGFTDEEVRSTFLEMPSYKHLKPIILDMTDGGQQQHD